MTLKFLLAKYRKMFNVVKCLNFHQIIMILLLLSLILEMINVTVVDAITTAGAVGGAILYRPSLVQTSTLLRHQNVAANYELIENDSRFISYQDLMVTATQFIEADVTSYSEMLFDVARNQLIVGARDTLYRMSFDLMILERTKWEAKPSQIAMCQAKGQSEHLCRNYVRVLQTYGDNQLYACGTYAFNPNCTTLQMENLQITEYDSGVGKCPFNPLSNITSIMTNTGEIYVGTATDFSGSDAAIIRSNIQKSNQANVIIRTKQYNNNWLNNPQFVGSFEVGDFIYFVFRETAVEYMNCGKIVYSRIARVCKNDAGGVHILRDNWTSFLKARLNCSIPGEYPFYFNEIQDITYSHDENILYGIFTTPDNSIHGSAICAFDLSAINKAFEGPFKYQESMDAPWKGQRSAYDSQFRCEAPTSNQTKHLLESSKYQLMEWAVQPLTLKPIYYSKLERFSHIAMDIVNTKTEKINILYIANNQNIIKKLSVKNVDGDRMQTCLVEAWKTENSPILNMDYLKVTDSLYVGTEHSLTRLPAQHCNRHVSRATCLNAMDPYCGWNDLLERCTAQELAVHLTKFWIQADVLKCPIMTVPIDGGWSAWSNWFNCKKHNDDDGNCKCRQRECNNPHPRNGGKECSGITTEVTNCTVHGGWTEWSAWSACSQTCGIAVKTKRRTCGNPKPAFGGRTCVGSERAEMYCRQLPPCPAPKPVAIDGGWGPWGEWSECSASCGGGFRIRRRECNDPQPQNGGQDCPGCNIDYEDCNMHACPEVKKFSSWTPWLVHYNKSHELNNGITDVHSEKRFRFVCRAITPDANSVHVSLAKSESRICRGGTCQRHNDFNALEEMELVDWGPCNVTCGGGVQYRQINENKHRSRHVQSRACNMHACTEQINSYNEVISMHEWSCWSEWSPCTVTCGIGLRRRTRKCLGGHDRLCNGRSVEEEKCERKPCEDFLGWSTWSEWSDCTSGGIRFRYRKCLVEQPDVNECRGEEFEKTACVPGQCEGAQVASTAALGSIIATIILLNILTIFMTFWLTRRHFMHPVSLLKNNNAPSSVTNYDSYSNQYSSLPTKDIYDVRPKVKRQSSFNMCSSPTTKNFNTSTLNRNNINHNHTPKVLAKTYNDCETGTLKRNSNTLNNHRSNLDDEKF